MRIEDAIKAEARKKGISEIEVLDKLNQYFEIKIPCGIFNSKLAPLEAISAYLIQKGFSKTEISNMLNRSPQSIWQSLRKNKLEKLNQNGIKIPISAFRNDFGILESACIYLKNQGHSINKISNELNRKYTTIWTTIRRVKK